MEKARIIEEHKTNYGILDGKRELIATVRGSFFTEENFPKVGDYILFTELTDGKAVIEEILPRTSTIARKNVDDGTSQVIVTNVDTIFIVVGLDNDFNISRIERYILLAKQSNVKAVIVLNKSDAVENVDEYIAQTESISGDVPVLVVSALTNHHMELFLSYVVPGTTSVLLGSSGAGKSTITNWLLDTDTQKVSMVRGDDDRGMHTTTSRQLFSLPNGACIIDTPGMRELGVYDSTHEDENEVFAKIDELSRQCTFSNCDHEKSKGCAVLAAIHDEIITERQLKSYQKIVRERLFEESKNDVELSRKQKLKLKKLRMSYDDAQTKKHFENEL